MKILHIIDSGGLYGAERVVLHLMTEQVQMGLEPILASIGGLCEGEKPIEREARGRGLRVEAFRMRNGPNWVGAHKILRFAQLEGADVIHSHGYKGNILFGLLPRRLRGIPLVSTLHGWTAIDRLSKMKVYEWLDRFSLRFIDAVVLVNQGMLTHPALNKKRQIHPWVVNNGLPSKKLSGARDIDPSTRDFCLNRFVIGAVGRLSMEKGISDLVDALHILRQTHKQVRLILIGEGEQRTFIENKIRKFGIGDHVLMTGYLPDAGRYLSLISILVMPSLTEGLPIAILEAMRAGVPIVASKVGGIPYVLRDEKSALLVPPSDPAGLANAIARLFDKPELGLALAAEARRLFERHYTSDQMAWGYRRIYERIASPAAQRIGWNDGYRGNSH